MKTLLSYSILFFALILFSACPYSSSVSIDRPSVKIDEKLLGKWDSKSSTEYIYTVKQLDAMNYRIEKKSINADDVTEYKAFLSDIDGVRYLNIYEGDLDDKTYYFYKLDITASGSKVTLLPVTENIDENFETEEELKDFFRKNQKLSFFFDKEEDVYTRAD